MANPTFNSTDLTTDAPREIIGGIRVRAYLESLPGVDGEYAQPHGTGGRDIIVRGILKSSSQATAALAHSTLKTTLRTKQDLSDGSTVAAYVGTDGNSYANCLLISYDAMGPVQVSQQGASTFYAYVVVLARVRDLAP